MNDDDDDKIIRFETLRYRRVEAETEAEQMEWEALRERLLAVMMASDQPNTALVSATINALLDTLQRSDMDFAEAKNLVALVLRAMH